MSEEHEHKGDEHKKKEKKEKFHNTDVRDKFRAPEGEKNVSKKVDPHPQEAKDLVKDKESKHKLSAEVDFLADYISEKQDILYAQNGKSLLIVLQAMDTGGKDSLIKQVFGTTNPQGCSVHSFKGPSKEEQQHDYLWRIHKACPERGMIKVFNRSHYEDVLIHRVRKLTPDNIIDQRYEEINNFEKMLTQNNTVILKFWLHISKAEQKNRLQARLDDKEKTWKFSSQDLKERVHWDAYMDAYDVAINKCSTKHAPWYVIPADSKPYARKAVASIIASTMDEMGLAYPTPEAGLDKLVISD